MERLLGQFQATNTISLRRPFFSTLRPLFLLIFIRRVIKIIPHFNSTRFSLLRGKLQTTLTEYKA